jgi:hypothetical protein
MPPIQRNIVLDQLVGVTEPVGDAPAVEVAHAVDQIFLNGLRIGFVGHKPTDPINFIRPGVLSDKPTLAAIVAAVQTKFGGQPRKVNGVPEVTNEEALDLAEGRGVGETHEE